MSDIFQVVLNIFMKNNSSDVFNVRAYATVSLTLLTGLDF